MTEWLVMADFFRQCLNKTGDGSLKRTVQSLVFSLSCLLVPIASAQREPTETGPEAFQIRCDFQSADDVDLDAPFELIFLSQCLRDPDPAIRDGIGYTVMADILRNHRPDDEMLREVEFTLRRMVSHSDHDADGFAAPFAILALSEVARTDRVEPWMSPEERTELIALGADYLADLTDYRGFSDEEGWRHGVAHTADLFMQFSLNDAITMEDAALIVEAVTGKVAPPDAPAYVFGEPERLARPILFLARAGLRTDEQWAAFFDALKPNEDDPRWLDPYMSEAGLAAIHNTKAFAMVLCVNASVSEAPELEPIRAGALELLTSIP